MPTLKERIGEMSLRTFFKNIYHMFTFNSKEKYVKDDQRFDNQKIINEMMLYYIDTKDWDYSSEFRSFVDNGVSNFPYQKCKEFGKVCGGYNKTLKLPYVLHKQKKLYFSKDINLESALNKYKNYIEVECLLGGGYMEKAPHQYQTDTFRVEKGDILVDVGCAEALLSLDVIDKVSHIYLIEGDSRWIPALEATFAPYKDKVTIINKYVTDKDSDNTIKLSTILKKEFGKNMFIKMDIEGFETSVLKSSVDLFSNNPNIKCACCTYHRNGDEVKIKDYFEKLSYKTEFSDGVMYFDMYDEPTPPYFRKGLIRAKKITING